MKNAGARGTVSPHGRKKIVPPRAPEGAHARKIGSVPNNIQYYNNSSTKLDIHFRYVLKPKTEKKSKTKNHAKNR